MKKLSPPNKRPRRNQPNLFYGTLEPRQMLSADLDMARNLVVNNDFETEGSTAFIAFADGDDTNLQEVRVVTIETDRSNIVEVDRIAGQIDSLAQDVLTEIDEQYVLSFDLRGRPIDGGGATDTNDVEVFFDGVSQGIFTGIDNWQTITLTVTSSSDLTRLEFREASSVSDGRGILIDHVGLAAVRESVVVNGSFENIEGEIVSGVVDADQLPGFHAVTEAGEIGVWDVTDATDGDNVLNLNTSNSRLDRIFQNVRTEAGSTYFVTFDLRNGDATDSNPTNLRLRWNNEFAGSFLGTTEWQRYGVLLTADSSFSTLLFREAGTNLGVGTGPQLDNLGIYRVNSLTSDFGLDLNGSADGTGNSTSFIENNAVGVTASDLQLTFANGSILSSATARILDGTGTEQLSAETDGTGIRSEYDSGTGILRLVGRASVSTYQQVLRTLQYTDSSDDPEATTRRIVVSVTDGTATSDRPEIAVDIVPVNDAPVATPLQDIDLPLDNPLTVNVGVVDPDDNNLDYQISVSGDTEIFGGTLPTISDTGQIQLTAVRDGVAQITVTVTDEGGLSSQFTFSVESPFRVPTGPIPTDFAQFSGQRQLTDTDPSLRNGIYDSPPPFNIDTSLNYQAVIETDDGEIRFELFAQESPLTVNNFINLAEDGFYDGVTFHRVIAGFVAQGGDPTGIGSGGPGYQFADELDNGLEFNGFGQLAMANAGANTNGSQFFFTLNDNPSFVGQHTIFGQVIAGEDVLRAVTITGTGDAEIIRRVRIETV